MDILEPGKHKYIQAIPKFIRSIRGSLLLEEEKMKPYILSSGEQELFFMFDHDDPDSIKIKRFLKDSPIEL